MLNSERTATFFGVIVAGASILDWYLFDTLRNPPYTEQERFLYENFLDRPARVMSFPEMSIVGVAFLLAYCLVIVWSSNLAGQTVKQLWRTVRELTTDKNRRRVILPISLLSLLAAVPAGYVTILFHNGAYLYPKVMGSYFAMLCGLYVYVFIFSLMLLATGRRDYGRAATDHRQQGRSQ
jgi:hypothetical protein